MRLREAVDRVNGSVLSTPEGACEYLLARVAPTRFRLVGASGLVLVFDLEGGAVRAARLLDSGSPVLKLVPKAPKGN